jgi:hypothetical protein
MEVAPYVDVTLDAVPDLAALPGQGVRVVNLGFVTAAAGCRPAWGGTLPHDAPAVLRAVRGLRKAGGDVRVSFGGERSQELALACPTPQSLAAAYTLVIEALHASLVDLDVEGAALADRDAVHRRNVAVRLLEAAARRSGRPLRVSYTLPAEGAGLSADAQALLQDARDAGVELDAVDAMTMNLGVGSGDLATAATTVAAGTEAVVRRLWPGPAGGGAWNRVAVTPMIGRNDLPSEVFGLADATRLAAFARRHGLAWISFWSLNRDRACAPGTRADAASPSCSGVEQQPGAFTAAFLNPGP